ncbi:MAG TPA: hypothetical protein VF804_13085 [Holophagaceae bacterium]
MATRTTPKRPKITGITLNVLMPDGTTRIHTLDPVDSDALAWSDRGVKILGKFYEKGGPAEGKRMTREDFLRRFPQAAKLIGKSQDILMTPELIERLWNLPKEDGTTPAFLCKNVINSSNG